MNVNANVEKSTQNSLDKLLKKLRHLQHNLTSELRTEFYIHDKLLSACRDIKTCSYVCYMSTSIMTNLIDNLRSFIMIYQTANSFNFLEIFFTNRKYHKFFLIEQILVRSRSHHMKRINALFA